MEFYLLGLAVVGVGMPRTGLTSLRVALGQLLNGPCHHGANFFDGKDETMDYWIRAFQGKLERQDWIDHFQGKGYRATVDLPTMLFHK